MLEKGVPKGDNPGTMSPSPPKRDESPNIRIVIADDHRAFAEALAATMRMEDDLQVVAIVYDGESAIEVAIDKEPDVVLMDLQMPGVDGIAATRRIKEKHPETRVVILSATEGEHERARALDAGAEGYLSKERSVKEVTSSVRAVSQGEVLVSPEESRRILSHLRKRRARDLAERERVDRLTPRETQILQGLADGLSSDRLAGKLEISRNTLRTHVQNILFKLKVHSKVEALALAIRHGKVRADEPV
jgi:DNA-binding NarL/FixJ family response regulator